MSGGAHDSLSPSLASQKERLSFLLLLSIQYKSEQVRTLRHAAGVIIALEDYNDTPLWTRSPVSTVIKHLLFVGWRVLYGVCVYSTTKIMPVEWFIVDKTGITNTWSLQNDTCATGVAFLWIWYRLLTLCSVLRSVWSRNLQKPPVYERTDRFYSL